MEESRKIETVADARDVLDLVLIWSYEHNAWWKPASWGYTTDRIDAGCYTREEAETIVERANLLKKNEAVVELDEAGPTKCAGCFELGVENAKLRTAVEFGTESAELRSIVEFIRRGFVSMRIDAEDRVHIQYLDDDGVQCYAYGDTLEEAIKFAGEQLEALAEVGD